MKADKEAELSHAGNGPARVGKRTKKEAGGPVKDAPGRVLRYEFVEGQIDIMLNVGYQQTASF